MPSLGPAEILVILLVALLVFGPNRMPEIARQLAKGVREFRRVQQHLTSELHGAMSELDLGDDEHGSTATPETRATSSSEVGDPVPSLPPKLPTEGEPRPNGDASANGDAPARDGAPAADDVAGHDPAAGDAAPAPHPQRNPPD
jgi:sec-independent protein translocase protein TatA